MYMGDNEDVYPPAYYYRNPNAGGSLDATGIEQWSGFMQPYIKNWGMFICGSDKVGGLPPTNFDDRPGGGNNLGTGPGGGTSFTPGSGIQDNQAPRLSYTANEALMPRPRGGIGGVMVGQLQNVVSGTVVENVANTIAATEFTDYLNAVSGTGPGGTCYKSHRPTDGWAMDAAGTLPYDTSAQMDPNSIYAISSQAAKNIFAAQPTAPLGGGSYPHLIYANSGRHAGGNTFIFADGHAKFLKVDQTLNCNRFMWGTRAYNQGNAVVKCAATGLPTQ
jgi:prepilin-type processing-associated H-X9-DG protein